MGKLGYLNTWVESPMELKPNNGRMLLAKVLQNETFKVVINLVLYKARVFNFFQSLSPKSNVWSVCQNWLNSMFV
jgi:hypothetical protein